MEFIQKMIDLLLRQDQNNKDKKTDKIGEDIAVEEYPNPHCEYGYRETT